MTARQDLTVLLRGPRFRRLFWARLATQFGDGAFQAGLAALIIFSPERQNTALALAGVFAVLLAPFTILGPFAGVFLDRWNRRQVLLWGNIARAAVTIACAVSLLTSGITVWLYVLALINLSINRFILVGFGAALPRVVGQKQLLVANSLLPSLGGLSSAAGIGVGLIAGLALPAGNAKDAAVLTGGAVIFVIAAVLSVRLGRKELGPDAVQATRSSVSQELRGTLSDLAAGARHLIEQRTPGHALLAMTLQRFAYGAMFMSGILVCRNLLADPLDLGSGSRNFALLTAATAAGYGLAIVVTPLMNPRFGPQRWMVICLGIGAGTQLVLAFYMTMPSLVAAGVVLGICAQSLKITTDTVVQWNTFDQFRGRAFALYDMLYNGAFLCSALLLAVAVPDTGYAVWIGVGLAIVHGGTAAWFAAISRRDAVSVAPAAQAQRTE